MAVNRVSTVKEVVNEKYLQNKILDWLADNCRGLFWQNDSFPLSRNRKRETRHRMNGISDILGTIKGKAIAIEVKTKTGKLLQSQINFSARFRAAGGEYYVIRSIDDLIDIAKINGWI